MLWLHSERAEGKGFPVFGPRRWVARKFQRERDRGTATTLLLMFMAIALCFASLLLFRIGHGNGLRTTAEQAADAGALGAAAEIRDRGALQIVNGVLPYGIIFKDGSRSAARHYADLNEGVADNVHASGLFGYTVKVDVHTKECQTKLDDPDKDAPAGRIRCRTGEDYQNGFRGKASAVAQVDFPECTVRPRGSVSLGNGPGQASFSTEVVCDGQAITSLAQARRLFTVKLVDKEDKKSFLPGLFSPGGGGPIPPGGVQNEANRQLGKQLAEQRGWTGEQWECLDQLWQHESGWNHLAENPSSGALGIPQALPPGKMATHGADYQTNPATQIRWGMDYIAARPDYGEPCRAWALWQSRSPHWY